MEIATAANGWINTIDSQKTEVLDTARHIIENNIYCTLSTCSSEGEPWVSPVFFAYDKNWTIYWSSATASQHSQNLYNNDGRVAIVIFYSREPGETVQGLYLQGKASEININQFEPVYQLLEQRAGKQFHRTLEDYIGDSPRRIYQFQAQKAWITGQRVPVGKQLVDTKIEFNWSDL